MPAPIESVRPAEMDPICIPPSSKIFETRDSISSIDSDVSLSFDCAPKDIDESIRSEKKEELKEEDEGTHMADLSDSASDSGSRDGGGKDSGCEVTAEGDVTDSEPPFAPPSNELSDKIVEQVSRVFLYLSKHQPNTHPAYMKAF